ncbi:MAG: hypothetical protein H7301_05335 [Cryobacterium sp.]|nr:hypothetical protein [Oligoflexia bacterium]
MSTWVIISWVFVFILTAVNVFIFLKLKGASEQMLKMAFPNAKNMNEALGQMQKMMGGMGGKMPNMGGMKGGNGNVDAQLQQAMAMLKNMKK